MGYVKKSPLKLRLGRSHHQRGNEPNQICLARMGEDNERIWRVRKEQWYLSWGGWELGKFQLP
jgi:hypothetical protein